jgi:integrase
MAEFGSIFTPVHTNPASLVYKLSPVIMSKYDELQHSVSISEINSDGMYERSAKPLYDYVTPHMLRKTAITSMLVNGVSEQHVKFASGHSEKSQSFERYKGFIDRNFQNEISSYYESFT